jgi:hypothetical protein
MVIFIFLALASCSDDKKPTEDMEGQADVQVVVLEIQDQVQPSPVLSQRYYETRIEVAVRNSGSGVARFDELRTAYYLDHSLVCGSTHVLDRDSNITAYFATESNKEPPQVPGVHTIFEVAPGQARKFTLDSVNSNFGLPRYKGERRIAVSLTLNNNSMYGPFSIPIPVSSTSEAGRTPSVRDGRTAPFSAGDIIRLTKQNENLEPGLYAIRSVTHHQVVLSRCWPANAIPPGHAAVVYSNGLAVGDERFPTSDSILSRCLKTGEHLSIMM